MLAEESVFFIDPRRERNPGAKPDAEVIYSYTVNKTRLPSGEVYLPPGWYWRCIDEKGWPEGGVNGPHPSKEAAIRDCRVQNGTGLVERLELYDYKTDLWREQLL